MSAPSALAPTLVLRLYGAARRLGLADSDRLWPLQRAAYFAYKRLLEDPFAGLCRRQPELFRGGDILDVGAHVGYTARLFARMLEPGMALHAFEPEPDNFRRLQQTLAAAASRIRLLTLCAAVGDAEGSAWLARNESHWGDHRIVPEENGTAGLRVPLTSVDGHLQRHGEGRPVAFIKIDVQGHEPAVCRGLAETLRLNPQASVAFELSLPADGGAEDPSGLPGFFLDRGMAVFVIDRGGRLAGVGRQPDLAQLCGARGYANLLASRRVG